jgi:hypothetical protein
MKYILPIVAAFLLTASVALAAPIYSNVLVTSGAVDSSGGTGAPDGDYIQINIDNGWAEFGFPEETTHDIRKVYVYETPNVDITQRPWISVEFLNGATSLQSGMQRVDSSTPAGNISSYLGTAPYDRVKFTKLSGDPLMIDSVWLEAPDEAIAPPDDPAVTPPDTTPPDTSTPDTEAETTGDDPVVEVISTPATITDNYPRLITLPDDGDPSTQYDTAVYAVNSDDGKRRPFFNETIYFSWFTDFSRVEVISAAEMASIPLGAPMWMHQGTWLIKVQSANEVYAVSRNGELHLVPDEETAISLYGTDWNSRVRDISPTDWPHYSVQTPIEHDMYPNDSIIEDESFIVWHVRNGVKRQVPTLDLGYHGIQSQHVIRKVIDLNFNHISGPEYINVVAFMIGATYTHADDFGWFDF